ncbi:MAG: class II D-tagatose-bisphosphate aldolase, non-catalytic subunit, partial [Bacteroidales bacterium]|nr:class II D-tagatose-bisphosphate aldolase, non-catalytic subunit [Bacteroidales bacterium]
MRKTEKLLQRIDQLQKETGIPRTIFAACPNSPTVIRASLRAAKRNNAPIYFAATLNQIDCDGGYTGMTQEAFVRTVRFETERVNFTGPVIVAIDHGGPWLKDKQRTEKWSTEDAMNGVKKSFEAAVLAGYDLIHVDPTVDINVPKGQTIDIHLVAKRTVELIAHV